MSDKSKLSGLLAIALFGLPFSLSMPASAQTTEEQACYNDVQNKVTWQQPATAQTVQWADGNVRRLCKGVTQRAQRISCFSNGIISHNDWNRAINECAQTGGTIASTALVPGKQCVHNLGGYALTVEWYNPGLVVFNGGDAKDYTKYTVLGKPNATENVALLKSSCTDAANRVAIARIQGFSIVNSAVTIAVGTGVGIGTSVAGAIACVGTAGAGCPAAVAGVTAAVSGAVSALGTALPEVKEIAYIGSPGTQNYLDLSGTAWNVGIANNVSLSKSRGLNVIGDWFTGGEPGPKSITFNNQAGYVAEMTVVYVQKQKNPLRFAGVQGEYLPLPVEKKSGKISVGRSINIDIPVEIENTPIQVFITGVATIKSQIYRTTIPANFSGNRCYKAYGTIFDATGSACN